ncbi:hypothetical protein OQA88_6063 [Cercophora sp. LCS_1]
MGIDDLLSFDAPLYTTKIRSLSTPDLQAREITKTRQFLSGSCTAGLGLGTAAATGGISLGFTALAGRNMQIAMAKLEIIKAELARRGVPTRDKLSTGDIVVPAVGGVVGMVVGAGVEGEMVEDHGIGEAIGPTAGEIVAANVVGVYGYCDQEMAVRDIEVKRKGGSLACGHCKTSITQGRAYGQFTPLGSRGMN